MRKPRVPTFLFILLIEKAMLGKNEFMTYNKTKNWNIAPSFPGNSFDEFQVKVQFKFWFYFMYFDINKILF